jgi:hypothetical protein
MLTLYGGLIIIVKTVRFSKHQAQYSVSTSAVFHKIQVKNIWNHATGDAWPSPAPLLWTLQASVEKVLEDYEEPPTPGQALVHEAMENTLKQRLSQPIRPKHPDVC